MMYDTSPVLWRLMLIDGRTGSPLVRDGRIVVAYSYDPEKTEAELLQGRDPLIWMCLARPADQETPE